GAYTARGATIISSSSELIAKQILQDMDRGVTVLNGKGSFTGEKREVLYCVVGRNEIVRLKNLINAVDPHEFVAVSAVDDVHRDGLTLDKTNNPIHED